MKHSHFLLITASMLFISSINLDASETSTNTISQSYSQLTSSDVVQSETELKETADAEALEAKLKETADAEALEVELKKTTAAAAEAKKAEELEKAIDFCKQEEGSFFPRGFFSHGPISLAIDWALKPIAPEEKTTAVKDMTDGLRKLTDTSKDDFEKLEKLATQTISETLKTDTLISAFKILEKIGKRLKVSNIIIHNKDNIQISEDDLEDFINLAKGYRYHAVTIFGIHFDFGKNNLLRQDQIHHRIQEKSLQIRDNNFESLDLESIITQVTGIPGYDHVDSDSEIDVDYGFETNVDSDSDSDSDSEIDEETQVAVNRYSSLWTFFSSDPVKEGLIRANQQTIDENLSSTAKKEMTDSLYELIKRNKNDDILISKTQSLTEEMVLSEKMQRRLEAMRFLLKNKANIGFDEDDLVKFSNTCKASQINDISILQQSFTRVQDEVKGANNMGESVHGKSFKLKGTDYKSMGMSPEEIFTIGRQSLEDLITAANKASQSLQESRESEES